MTDETIDLMIERGTYLVASCAATEAAELIDVDDAADSKSGSSPTSSPSPAILSPTSSSPDRVRFVMKGGSVHHHERAA